MDYAGINQICFKKYSCFNGIHELCRQTIVKDLLHGVFFALTKFTIYVDKLLLSDSLHAVPLLRQGSMTVRTSPWAQPAS
jgi:hypothetical protein